MNSIGTLLHIILILTLWSIDLKNEENNCFDNYTMHFHSSIEWKTFRRVNKIAFCFRNVPMEFVEKRIFCLCLKIKMSVEQLLNWIVCLQSESIQLMLLH